MWTEAQSGTQQPVQTADERLAADYVEKSDAMLSDWEQFIRAADGPVALWGGASKGVTFALLMADRDDVELACAIDLNKAKQGCFMPVTGLPIVGPEDAQKMGVSHVIVINPNYRDEIAELVKQMGWSVTITVLND